MKFFKMVVLLFIAALVSACAQQPLMADITSSTAIDKFFAISYGFTFDSSEWKKLRCYPDFAFPVWSPPVNIVCREDNEDFRLFVLWRGSGRSTKYPTDFAMSGADLERTWYRTNGSSVEKVAANTYTYGNAVITAVITNAILPEGSKIRTVSLVHVLSPAGVALTFILESKSDSDKFVRSGVLRIVDSISIK